MQKWIILLICAALCVLPIFAEEEAVRLAGDDTEELARAAQNPVADLISLPFQWNVGFDTGPDNRTSSVLNIQPVIPFNFNEDWNLITRTIVPIVNQPPVGTIDRQEFELGNAQFSAFFSPIDADGWLWGLGPIFEFPTHTGDVIASDNYSAGPAFVALKMNGPWVYGGLINQLWSFTNDDSEVNKMLIQPFVNYNMEDGWYLSSAPIMTADWTADSSDRWTIPVGGGIGKIVKLGKLPLNISTQAFYNVEKPEGGSEWSVRFQVQFLFPK